MIILRECYHVRHGGAQFPTLVQKYLGKAMRVFTDIVSVVLMVLVAAAFTAGPAAVISAKTGITFMRCNYYYFPILFLSSNFTD